MKKKVGKTRKNPEKVIIGKNGNKLNVGGTYEGGGRPKGSLNFKTAYSRLLEMDAPESLLVEIRKVNPNAKTIRDILAVSTLNRAIKGNPKAMELIHYYDTGKPVETIEMEQSIKGEVQLEVKIPDRLKKCLPKI